METVKTITVYMTAAQILEEKIGELGSHEWRNFKGFKDYGCSVNEKYFPKTLEAMEEYANMRIKQENPKKGL